MEALTEDRRNKAILLTAVGYAEAERILETIKQSEYQAMNGLTEEERRILLSAIRQEAMRGGYAVFVTFSESIDFWLAVCYNLVSQN